MSVSEEFPRTYKQITQPDAPSRTLSPLVTVSYVCATPISSLGSTASPTHIRTPALPKGYPSSLAYFFHSHLPYSRTFSLFLLGIKISSFLRPYRATILINSAGKSSLKRRSLALLPFLFELDNLSLLRRAAPFIFLNPASPSSSRRGAKVLSHFHPTSSPLSLSLVQESTSRIVIVIVIVKSHQPVFQTLHSLLPQRQEGLDPLLDRVDAFCKFIDNREGGNNVES